MKLLTISRGALAMMDYHDELGVPPSASADEIAQACRFLIQKFHPDRNPGHEPEAKTRFVRIQQAFEALSNPAMRREYDEQQVGRQNRSAPASDFEGVSIPLNVRRNHSNVLKVAWFATAVVFLFVVALIKLNEGDEENRLAKVGSQPAQITTQPTEQNLPSKPQKLSAASTISDTPKETISPKAPQSATLDTAIDPIQLREDRPADDRPRVQDSLQGIIRFLAHPVPEPMNIPILRREVEALLRDLDDG